nr:immunoglobulin light chain junction region [Macaca mulatta]MOX53108.1 immunoglobulin light chain junction region [Macaca mulatta]MOX53997.1 immunoglobulin light chain junction region [Macaca mulatta]MOX54288.1 immunoglobulin light chain junction region [Macaca mulatta]MOX54468.1 immunoglobulin light chain junction region [Macaca mulatta]
CQQHNTYPHTF